MTLAIIGLGSIGLRHARNALALGRAVTGFDPDPLRGELLAADGGSVAADRQSALQAAEAAIIASPNACHLDDLSATIAAGCHVLVEKPLTHTVDGLAALLRRADDSGLSVSVAQNLRVNPAVDAAKATIAARALGDILWCRMIAASYLPDWRPDQDYRQGYAHDARTGGALFDFIHEFDLAAALLGPFTTEAAVARRTGVLEIEAEDCADAILRHEAGPLTSLHVDYVTRPPQRVTQICGSNGQLLLDIAQRRLTHVTIDGKLVTDHRFDGDAAGDYVTEMREFLDPRSAGNGRLCGGWEGYRILEQVIRARAMAGLPQA